MLMTSRYYIIPLHHSSIILKMFSSIRTAAADMCDSVGLIEGMIWGGTLKNNDLTWWLAAAVESCCCRGLLLVGAVDLQGLAVRRLLSVGTRCQLQDTSQYSFLYRSKNHICRTHVQEKSSLPSKLHERGEHFHQEVGNWLELLIKSINFASCA